jgi:hypothetical protein
MCAVGPHKIVGSILFIGIHAHPLSVGLNGLDYYPFQDVNARFPAQILKGAFDFAFIDNDAGIFGRTNKLMPAGLDLHV